MIDKVFIYLSCIVK